ncbi:hypothetical protein OA264_00045 [Alphaproteobacteria bacterium]|nr:hypothetical protein [Alphaproteobacteria bacterium]
MGLILYNFTLLIFSPLIFFIIFLRVVFGKEDFNRYKEKLGFFNKLKKSKNKLIWFHACSVGEVKSISNLSLGFLNNNYSVLITTSTLLSADYVKRNFSNKVYHQYLPLDFSYSINRFLTHWKPNIAVIVESEIWPNLITVCKKKNIPLALIQASFSNKSLRNWSFFKAFFKKLLKSFDIIVAQSEEEKQKLYKFVNINIDYVYDLKNSSPKLEIKKKAAYRIKKDIKSSFIILACSTHAGEEKILLEALSEIIEKIKNVILIIQPRHPKRANEIIKTIKNYNFIFKKRSLSQYPSKNTKVYLADTFGESGTLIFAADIVVLGGTLVPVGGHNIIEPAQLSKCILVGSYFSKIKDTMKVFRNAKAIKLVKRNNSLSKIIIDLYNDKNTMLNIGKNAFSVTQGFPKKENEILNKIISLEKKNENTKILVQT